LSLGGCRGLVCVGLSGLLNATARPMCGANYTRPQIAPRSMFVLALAGLRGGTAFALALRWDNDSSRIAPIETLTMGVILLTLCGAGESPRPAPAHAGQQPPPVPIARAWTVAWRSDGLGWAVRGAGSCVGGIIGALGLQANEADGLQKDLLSDSGEPSEPMPFTDSITPGWWSALDEGRLKPFFRTQKPAGVRTIRRRHCKLANMHTQRLCHSRALEIGDADAVRARCQGPASPNAFTEDNITKMADADGVMRTVGVERRGSLNENVRPGSE
jgi:hypothetical protein